MRSTATLITVLSGVVALLSGSQSTVAGTPIVERQVSTTIPRRFSVVENGAVLGVSSSPIFSCELVAQRSALTFAITITDQ